MASTTLINKNKSQFGSTQSMELLLLPTANSNRYVQGSDAFEVYFKDQGGLYDNITIQVSIEPVNDLPEISGTFLNTLSHLKARSR